MLTNVNQFKHVVSFIIEAMICVWFSRDAKDRRTGERSWCRSCGTRRAAADGGEVVRGGEAADSAHAVAGGRAEHGGRPRHCLTPATCTPRTCRHLLHPAAHRTHWYTHMYIPPSTIWCDGYILGGYFATSVMLTLSQLNKVDRSSSRYL